LKKYFEENFEGFLFQNQRASQPQGWLALCIPAHPLHSEKSRLFLSTFLHGMAASDIDKITATLRRLSRD
jgi:hypothetical protein